MKKFLSLLPALLMTAVSEIGSRGGVTKIRKKPIQYASAKPSRPRRV